MILITRLQILRKITQIDYAYDWQVHRVQQQINGGQETNYLWDVYSPYGDVILEANASDVVQAEYVLGGTELISQTRGGQNDYYLTDALGSVRLMTDGAGTVTNTYRYDAFGNLVAQTGSRANSYLYTGQQYDATTGLYSLRARYYDPGAGRFLSYDTWPIDLQNPLELNRYGYGMNNPVRWRDPSGRTSSGESGLLNSTLGAVSYAVRFVVLGRADKHGLFVQFIAALVGGAFQGGFGYWLGVQIANAVFHQDKEFDHDEFWSAILAGISINSQNFLTARFFIFFNRGQTGTDNPLPPKDRLQLIDALAVFGYIGAIGSLSLELIYGLLTYSEEEDVNVWSMIYNGAINLVMGWKQYNNGLGEGLPPSGIIAELEPFLTILGNVIGIPLLD